MNLSLVVLAAGMGSRYGGLKQMDPIGPHGETVLDYSVYDAWRAGFSKVIFVIRKDFAETFQESIVQPLSGKIDVICVHQDMHELPGNRTPPAGRTKPWGTAHAIWTARHAVDGPFAVINADDFYGAGAFRTLKKFFEKASAPARPLPCSLVAYRLRNTLSEHGGVSRGVLDVSDDGFLRGIQECTDVRSVDGQPVAQTSEGPKPLDSETLVSMNCWGFQPGILNYFEHRIEHFLEASGQDPKAEIYVADPVENAIRAQEATFRVLPNEENWFGVTYKEDKEQATSAIESLIEAGRYPRKLWT